MMADRTTLRRALVVGLAALAAALGLFTVLPASATHVNPALVQGNAPCPAGMTELKIEPVADGTFSDGTLTVTIDVRDTALGQVFDWSSNIGVDVVIVKGGSASNVYTYAPEATSDTGLHAPLNRSGSYAGLSHISFCYDAGEEPTTTTTTTAPTTTTTTTMPPTTTTSTSSTSTTTPSTTAPPTSSSIP
jgi:hypothetical protein